jgi:hypothetical protein
MLSPFWGLKACISPKPISSVIKIRMLGRAAATDVLRTIAPAVVRKLISFPVFICLQLSLFTRLAAVFAEEGGGSDVIFINGKI